MPGIQANQRFKIAMVVMGRIDSFELVNALLARGHDIRLFTNYPKWAVKRFSVPEGCVTSFWPHGVVERILKKIAGLGIKFPEAWIHSLFGRWAARMLKKNQWDLIHVYSGVAEEILNTTYSGRAIKVVMRASTHIKTQSDLLESEKKRAGEALIETPSTWMINREIREYCLADYIRVTSNFVYQSFIRQGVPEKKLWSIPSAIPFDLFKPSQDVVDARCRRILSNKPLRIIYVGTLQYRKGIFDLAKVIGQAPEGLFEFCCVGPVQPEAAKLLSMMKNKIHHVTKQPQSALRKWYAWADVYLFPTIEDGFPQTLAQAFANALPLITTPNSSAPDFIKEGENGWILPIRRSDLLFEKLSWCHRHREELSSMVRCMHENLLKSRSWNDAAEELEIKIFESLKK
ncbi:MAG: glycosyltransferase family 4 protein [Candidatus Omnitrophica bacterium]|nr:glycosyltransferase family 4 protein [Candidatus Omnitrophota bacterium]